MNPEVVSGVRRIAGRFTARNPRLAIDEDDLVQEGLLAVWQSDHPAWPYTARLAMIDWLRHTYGRKARGYRTSTVTRWDSLDAPAGAEATATEGDLLPAGVDVATEAAERVDAVRRLADLPERDRGIVWARGVGTPLHRIGAAHGISEAGACQVVRKFRKAA